MAQALTSIGKAAGRGGTFPQLGVAQRRRAVVLGYGAVFHQQALLVDAGVNPLAAVLSDAVSVVVGL